MTWANVLSLRTFAIPVMFAASLAPQQVVAAGPLVAPSGQPIRVVLSYMVNPDCTKAGDVTIRLTSPPGHGHVTIRNVRANPNFNQSNPRHVCNTHKVEAIAVIYTSRPGYLGPDRFSIDQFYSDGELRQTEYVIDVR